MQFKLNKRDSSRRPVGLPQLACAFFLCAILLPCWGCAPAETEKVQYNDQDAELIIEQIDKVYGDE